MPRDDVSLTTAEAREFLAGARTAILVTLGPDGYPDPVAMWFVLDADGVMWMRTYASSQKVRNVARDPRVSVLVEDGDTYATLRGVQLTGRMALVDDIDVICDVFAGLMVKYEGMDPAHVPAARAGYRATAAKQRALRLDVERTVSWDHRKQGGSR
jgi:PPOX class probable F420-dependent enzyme